MPQRTFVRGDHRRSIEEHLVAGIEGHEFEVLILRGPTGCGKTRLAERIVGEAEIDLDVRRTAFEPGHSVGLGPLRKLVLRPNNDPSVLQPGFGADGATTGMLIDRLMAECPGGALVLIEDLHWADPAAMAAVHQLIESASSTDARFVFLLSVRDDNTNQAETALAGLEALARAEVVDVPALAEDEVHSLVRSLGFPRVDAQLIELLCRASMGNPLYVLETVREMYDRGSISVVADRLIGHTELVAHLPRELRSLIASRLARLGADAEYVALVALLGRHATKESVSALGSQLELSTPSPSGPTNAALANAEQRAVALGLVRFDGTALVTAHQLVGQAALDRLPDGRLADLHARAAEHLLDRGVAIEDLVGHLIEGGMAASPAMLDAYGLKCIEAMISAGAWGTAGRLGEIMIGAGTTSYHACLATGLAHQRNADPERSAVAYDRAIELAERSGDRAVAVTAHCWMARSRAFSNDLKVSSTLVGGITEVGRRPEVSVDNTLMTRIHASTAEILCAAGLVDEGIEAGRRAVRAAGTSPDLLAAAHSSNGISLMSTLDLDEADRSLRAAFTHATETDETHLQVVTRSRAAWMALTRGQLDQAETDLVDGDELVNRSGSWADRCLTASAWCALALARGDLADLHGHSERALRLVHRSEYYLGPFLLYPTLISGALAEGDNERAWTLLDDWTETGHRGQGPARLLTRLEEGSIEQVRRELEGRPPASRWHGAANFANLGTLAMVMELAQRCGVAGTGFDWLARDIEDIAASDLRLVPTFPATGRMLWADALRCMGDAEGAAAIYGAEAEYAASIGAPLVQARALLRQAASLPKDSPDRLVAGQGAASIAERLGASGLAAEASGVLATAEVGARATADGSTPLALMLTDVVSSTAIADLHGDPIYADVIDLHDRLTRTEIRRFGGQEFEHTGDGIFAWFTDAGAALACSRAVQRVIRREVSGARLNVRVSAVYGDSYFRRGRPYGGLCNLGARVCDLASPGSIVITDSVRLAVDETMLARPLPPTPLKGIANPPLLYEIVGQQGDDPHG